MELINFDDFQFRASMVGYLMTNPKGGTNLEKYEKCVKSLAEESVKMENTKNKTTATYEKLVEKVSGLEIQVKSLYQTKDDVVLSDTTITKLIEIYIEATTGRRKDITTRYMEKGTKVEDDAILLLNEFRERFPYFEKNKVRKFGEFTQGECDVDNSEEDEIIDIKSCWDYFTFLPHSLELVESDEETIPENKIYYWQAQVYMELYNCKRYSLAYCLINTPQGLIDDECKRFLYKLGSNQANTLEYRNGCEEIKFNNTFDDLDVKQRVIELKFKRNDEEIQKLHQRIVECRKWLNNYAKKEFVRNGGVLVEEVIADVIITENCVKNDVVDSPAIVVDSPAIVVDSPAIVVDSPAIASDTEKIQNCKTITECINLYKSDTKFQSGELKDKLSVRRVELQTSQQPTQQPVSKPKKEPTIEEVKKTLPQLPLQEPNSDIQILIDKLNKTTVLSGAAGDETSVIGLYLKYKPEIIATRGTANDLQNLFEKRQAELY